MSIIVKVAGTVELVAAVVAVLSAITHVHLRHAVGSVVAHQVTALTFYCRLAGRSSRAVHLVALVVAVEDSVAELVGAHAGGAVPARRVVRAAAGGRGGRAAARLLVRPVRAVHGPVAHPAQRDTTTWCTCKVILATPLNDWSMVRGDWNQLRWRVEATADLV